jgi:hypothetical protein
MCRNIKNSLNFEASLNRSWAFDSGKVMILNDAAVYSEEINIE